MALIQVHITATKDQVGEPILYRLAKDFNVVTNVRRAQVEEDYAFVAVDIEGSLSEVQRAIAWLQTTGLHIDPQERSVSDRGNL